MHFFAILAVAGLAAAIPTPEESTASGGHLLPPGEKVNHTHIDPDAAHENTLKTWNPDHIIHSDNLFAYFENNRGANHTIYLNDTRKLVDLSRVKLVPQEAKDGENKREIPDYCWNYPQYWAEQIQSWFGSWNPASSCLWTGYSQGPASVTLGWSYSKSIETNSGLDWNVIKDALSVNAGFSVTETWSHSGSWTCQIPSQSVGQIWISNRIVWGWMWQESCQQCTQSGSGCWGATAVGGASAPVDATDNGVGVQYGCSTGSDKVQC